MKWFDAWFGTHQKINRVARKHLETIHSRSHAFPSKREIARFEGLDGPDGIKRKNPGNEPWHFVDPFDADDEKLVRAIEEHFEELVLALRTADRVRASFEAAWLSHAIVDGLTPAHHYPYEEELVKLRGGESLTKRRTKEQLLMPGETVRKMLSNNWKMWGDKGLLATHFAFEWGVAIIIAPLRLARSKPHLIEIEKAKAMAPGELFMHRAQQIASLRMYDEFYRSGWTPRLANQVRRELAPLIINTVVLMWYLALHTSLGSEAQLTAV